MLAELDVLRVGEVLIVLNVCTYLFFVLLFLIFACLQMTRGSPHEM